MSPKYKYIIKVEENISKFKIHIVTYIQKELPSLTLQNIDDFIKDNLGDLSAYHSQLIAAANNINGAYNIFLIEINSANNNSLLESKAREQFKIKIKEQLQAIVNIYRDKLYGTTHATYKFNLVKKYIVSLMENKHNYKKVFGNYLEEFHSYQS